MRRLFASLALLLAAGACAHGEGVSGPPEPDAARLYRNKCASCHRLKDPAEHDAATWRRAVDRFGAHLTPEERSRLSAWLAAGARPQR